MRRVRVIPVLLLKAGALVKTLKFKRPEYIGDPINAVKIFNDREVDELIFLDIDATPTQTGPDFETIRQIAVECFMPLCYGGGIRTLDEIAKLFSLGVEKVAICSSLKDESGFQLIKSASMQFGSQSIVGVINIGKTWLRDYAVYFSGNEIKSTHKPVEFAKKIEAAGAGEILINSIDLDGTMNGYDLNLISMIAESVSIPVIACGGAGGIEDFCSAVKQGRASAVGAGAFFVYQKSTRSVLISFPEPEELLPVHQALS